MRVLARHSHPAALLTRWPAYSLIASTLAGLWLMQSAFNVAPLHTSLPGITAAEPVAGIVLGIVVFGDRIRVSPGLILLEASGLITLLIGVILVARSPALSRRHRSRPPPGLSCIQRGSWQPPDRGASCDEEESVMGVAKKAKHEAKAAKSKTKKDAGKVKHKGKKVKNAAKH
jgi:hypothetical protein